MDELLTTKQVQARLQVDRTTIYRMLNDGRLNGVKIGQHWRFSRQEVDDLMAGRTLLEKKNARDQGEPFIANVLPLSCIQNVQDVFAEIAQVGAVLTSIAGEPLTEISNSCKFCNLILGSKSGRQACIASWHELGTTAIQNSSFTTCHAGLQYARARIDLGDNDSVMLVAGQFYTLPPSSEENRRHIQQLAEQHQIDSTLLEYASREIPILDDRTRDLIGKWLEKVGATFAHIAMERSDLINRLNRIAAMSNLMT